MKGREMKLITKVSPIRDRVCVTSQKTLDMIDHANQNMQSLKRTSMACVLIDYGLAAMVEKGLMPEMPRKRTGKRGG